MSAGIQRVYRVGYAKHHHRIFSSQSVVPVIVSWLIEPYIHFRFCLAVYPAVFYYPVLVPDPAEMLNGTGYHNQIFYCQYNSIITRMSLTEPVQTIPTREGAQVGEGAPI